MSAVATSAALEKALKALSPSIATALENERFPADGGTPPHDQPYQRVHVLFGQPDDNEIGARFTERGILNVLLLYPADAGWGAARARAELIRAAFPIGRTIPGDGIVVSIERTPEIAPGQPDGDRYAVPVRVRFVSNQT